MNLIFNNKVYTIEQLEKLHVLGVHIEIDISRLAEQKPLITKNQKIKKVVVAANELGQYVPLVAPVEWQPFGPKIACILLSKHVMKKA